jgi:hypothetical protein
MFIADIQNQPVASIAVPCCTATSLGPKREKVIQG